MASEKIERFIVLLYSRTSDQDKVNEARKQLFSQGGRAIENIPPTQAALLEHLKRATYQGGHVWGQALVVAPVLPSPADWGWVEEVNEWRPFWTTLPEASEVCYELIKCGCKKACGGKCKCKKNALKCTELCGCQGGCAD